MFSTADSIRGVGHSLRGLMVLLLAAGSTSVGAAEAVSGSVVRDLYYGETLFHSPRLAVFLL